MGKYGAGREFVARIVPGQPDTDQSEYALQRLEPSAVDEPESAPDEPQPDHSREPRPVAHQQPADTVAELAEQCQQQ